MSLIRVPRGKAWWGGDRAYEPLRCARRTAQHVVYRLDRRTVFSSRACVTLRFVFGPVPDEKHVRNIVFSTCDCQLHRRRKDKRNTALFLHVFAYRYRQTRVRIFFSKTYRVRIFFPVTQRDQNRDCESNSSVLEYSNTVTGLLGKYNSNTIW